MVKGAITDTTGLIDITSLDLVAFVKACYRASRAQGLGVYHYEDGDLDDEAARSLLRPADNGIALSLDYVKGRAVKMVAWRDAEGRVFIRNDWFDHSRKALIALLLSLGLDGEKLVEDAVNAEASIRVAKEPRG